MICFSSVAHRFYSRVNLSFLHHACIDACVRVANPDALSRHGGNSK